MSVTFRDKSNNGNWSMSDYSDVTVIMFKSRGQKSY